MFCEISGPLSHAAYTERFTVVDLLIKQIWSVQTSQIGKFATSVHSIACIVTLMVKYTFHNFSRDLLNLNILSVNIPTTTVSEFNWKFISARLRYCRCTGFVRLYSNSIYKKPTGTCTWDMCAA